MTYNLSVEVTLARISKTLEFSGCSIPNFVPTSNLYICVSYGTMKLVSQLEFNPTSTQSHYDGALPPKSATL